MAPLKQRTLDTPWSSSLMAWEPSGKSCSPPDLVTFLAWLQLLTLSMFSKDKETHISICQLSYLSSASSQSTGSTFFRRPSSSPFHLVEPFSSLHSFPFSCSSIYINTVLAFFLYNSPEVLEGAWASCSESQLFNMHRGQQWWRHSGSLLRGPCSLSC